MDDFKIWCISFCLLLVITSVMRFAVPECKMKKVSDSVLSLIILLVLFIPFTDKISESENKFAFDLEDYSQAVEDDRQYEAALEKYIKDTLEAEGISCKSIEVTAELDKDGYIDISGIDITVSESDQAEYVIEIIKNKCGLDTEKVKIN